MKLSAKFAIAFFISSFISIFFVGVLSYMLIGKSLQQTIIAYQQEITTKTINSIDQFLYQNQQSLQSIADRDSIIAFINNQNDATIREKVNYAIQTYASTPGFWKKVVLVTEKGKIVYGAPEESISAMTPAFSSLLKSVEHGKVTVSDIVVDIHGQQAVLVGIPIVNRSLPNRPIIGAIIGYLSWDNVLAKLQSANGKIVELYNAQGLLIADSQHKTGGYMKKTSLSSTILKMIGEKKDETHIQGQELISFAVEKGVSSYKGNRWILAVRTPLHVAFAPAINTAITIAILLLPVIIVVNGILLLLLLHLLEPLQLIGEAAQEVARGNFAKRISYTSDDEVGWLADSFNTMAQTLQQMYEDLEKKVQEKTKELSEKIKDAETMNSFMIKRELKIVDMKKQLAELKESSKNKTE